MNLRPYQEEMVTVAMNRLRQCPSVLIQAATGAGKTVVFSEIIKRYLQQYPKMKILVLVHREVIVRQNADKLRSIWTEAPVSIACAGIQAKKELSGSVVYASIQTLATQKTLESLPAFNLVIVDEAHRLPPKHITSQYQKVLNALSERYQSVRLLGFTATPYRLNWGYIYGNKHKGVKEKGCQNWFIELDYSVGIEMLQTIEKNELNPDAPYLCNMRVFAEDNQILRDLKSIKKTAGDFNQGDLSETMTKTVHLQSAIDAYKKHVDNRTRCVVFAVDIEHAEELQKAFQCIGIYAVCVHSKMTKDMNRQILSEFDAGLHRIVINVGILTEGWDCRSVDMLMLCRPTMSAALFVQMVGRGLRTFPGKKDVMILDLAGCFSYHGSPYNPLLPIYSESGEKREPKEQPEKECPNCHFMNNGRVWSCEQCGTILRVKQFVEAPKVELKEIDLKQKKISLESTELKGEIKNISFSKYIKSTGEARLKVSAIVNCLQTDRQIRFIDITVNHFFALEGGGRYYFSKFFRKIFESFVELPKTIDEAIERLKEKDLKMSVTIQKDGKYWKIKDW